MSNPRAEYSPIVNRKPLKLPNGARLAVWVVVNIENWDINARMARSVLPTPQGASVIPDIPNYSWHDYGMRVGFWRLKESLDRNGIRATVALNGSVCEEYPPITDAIKSANWDIMGHGYIQRALPLEDDERATIRKTIDVIKGSTGISPRGWLGPGLAETFDTPDVLAEEGIEYVGDWVNDDQPYPLKVKSGSLISIPYTLETNDITIYVVQNHRSPELFERGKDQFDTLYREGAENARIMCIAVHPYISGVPHRTGYFDALLEYAKFHEGVLFMTGAEILDWYKSTL